MQTRASTMPYHHERFYAPDPVCLKIGGTRVDLHYLELGHPAPDRPSIVMAHGVGAAAAVFSEESRVADTLGAQGFHVLAPDLPGHGRSAPVDVPDVLPYSLDGIGTMLVQFGRDALRSRGSSRFVIVAHSLAAGAAITWLSHFAATGAEPPWEVAGVLACSIPCAARVHWLLRGASSRH